jgi:hypothetical protein
MIFAILAAHGDACAFRRFERYESQRPPPHELAPSARRLCHALSMGTQRRPSMDNGLPLAGATRRPSSELGLVPASKKYDGIRPPLHAPGYFLPSSSIPDILGRRALPDACSDTLGASPYFWKRALSCRHASAARQASGRESGIASRRCGAASTTASVPDRRTRARSAEDDRSIGHRAL